MKYTLTINDGKIAVIKGLEFSEVLVILGYVSKNVPNQIIIEREDS